MPITAFIFFPLLSIATLFVKKGKRQNLASNHIWIIWVNRHFLMGFFENAIWGMEKMDIWNFTSQAIKLKIQKLTPVKGVFLFTVGGSLVDHQVIDSYLKLGLRKFDPKMTSVLGCADLHFGVHCTEFKKHKKKSLG